ncbi:MAG: glycosyltransferase family 2 protein [Chloroflexales bacterium]|nr:glycosyltransferase family 2 protein [Chloroflexales bacterium]
MKNKPKISFGIIVLNGEPFTRYNLRALYPFAHEIIVVEGASPYAASIASPNGHSVDGTLEILYEFKKTEDPEQKITIVTAEDEGYPNGFWPGEKDEQSQVYARRATGDWLWQVDIDEFYLPEDMSRLCELLQMRSDLAILSFQQIQFWGGLNWFVDGWYLRHMGGGECHRLFRWQPGYRYATHRPPTIVTPQGVDLRRLNWLRAKDVALMGITMYHYSLVFPSQVDVKSRYYTASFGRKADWTDQHYMALNHPFRVHNAKQYPSWLEAYNGRHPPQVLKMWEDLSQEQAAPATLFRHTDDIERLLASRWYRLGKWCLKRSGPIVYTCRGLALRVLQLLPQSARMRIKRLVPGLSRSGQ